MPTSCVSMSPSDRFSPLTRALLDNIRRAGLPPLHTLPLAAARQAYAAGVGAMSEPGPALGRVERLGIPGPAGQIPAMLWAPRTEAGLPVLLYLHGGGFVIGGLDTCEAMCRRVAQLADVAVVAIDYRLAPEHRFPAALEDSMAALRWLADHGHTLGLDTRRMAVAGDSAGGCLAASTALMARDAGIPLRLQALFYPTVQARQATESFKTWSRDTPLSAELMAWFQAQSAAPLPPDQAWFREPLFAPDHTGVAPAWIGLAECDPLTDEGQLYADRLRSAGVPVQVRVWPGVLHDFINMGRFIPEAGQAHAELAAAVRQAFAI
ncbi:alpha/beta hydrolase [uncultured Aquabacterium sp.]|uniref:alpha/beta hydrolase n=2 Tax=Aquabacterium TaxID=92793 RepID=UPI0025FE6C13|nr:alpha/beta hydrolase [uncultured Aquabacterium sp.]